MAGRKKLTELFTQLVEYHTELPVCRHLELALSEYKNITAVSDKHLENALTSYILLREYDKSIHTEENFLVDGDF